MDAEQICSLRPKLKKFLSRFDDCFRRSDTRGHLAVYVEGQLSDLPRKNCEPIADAAEMPPRTLQQFLSLLDWDHNLMKQELQHIVAKDHGGPQSIGILDETGCPKKGNKTPGVQRQWCGATGRTDNCVVTVHLSFARGDFHVLLDSELFLPESWSNDRPRCRAAGIPDDMVHRSKLVIALELLDRVRENDVTFDWLTFDEGYGKSVAFLEALRSRQQRFVAEVPKTFTGWIQPPQVMPPRERGAGRPGIHPHVAPGSQRFATVLDHLHQSPELSKQPWKKYLVKEGEKGPMVWEAKHVWFYPNGEHDVPLAPLHLVIARNVFNPQEIKFFIADAPPDTALTLLLLVAFSRWRVERCFEDEKTELGFDHFEGRSYVGLMRHQTITAVTHLFLAKMHQELRGEKTGVNRLPSPHRGLRNGAILVTRSPRRAKINRQDGGRSPKNTTSQCAVARQPPPQNHPPLTCYGNHT